jgi:hypothetical protein
MKERGEGRLFHCMNTCFWSSIATHQEIERKEKKSEWEKGHAPKTLK